MDDDDDELPSQNAAFFVLTKALLEERVVGKRGVKLENFENFLRAMYVFDKDGNYYATLKIVMLFISEFKRMPKGPICLSEDFSTSSLKGS
ncbi:hypothetical protein Tco_0588837 [Tanacetum coccineum]